MPLRRVEDVGTARVGCVGLARSCEESCRSNREGVTSEVPAFSERERGEVRGECSCMSSLLRRD